MAQKRQMGGEGEREKERKMIIENFRSKSFLRQ